MTRKFTGNSNECLGNLRICDSWKSFLSSLNESISLSSREQLQIPVTEFLLILKRNLRTGVNAMTRIRERSKEQVKRRIELNWLTMAEMT